MNRFETDFGKWVVQGRWLIICAAILMIAAAAAGLRHTTISNDTRDFFSEDNPQLQALELLENTYTKNDSVLFVIAPGDGDVFTRKTLAAVEELTEASWQIPYSVRVDSITNYQHTRAEEDDLIVENLVENALDMADADLARTKRIALSEPLLVNALISPSGHVAGVKATVLLPGKSLDEVPRVAAFARGLVDDIRKKHPGIDLYLTGTAMSNHAFGEATRKDMSTLVPLMFVALLIIMGISLRSFTGAFATLTVILGSTLTAMGLAGWLGIALTPASANAPTVILTLAVADSVHILAAAFQQMRLGKSKHEAVAESLRINLQPVFLTSITTVIGFLSMNFSDAPPFRDLGNIVAMGVAAAFVYSVLLLPALIAVLPARVKSKPGEAQCSVCDRLATFVIDRRSLLFWGMPVLIVMLSAGISRIELNDDWIKYFDETYEIRGATDFMEKHLSGFHTIEYSLESGETGGINKPEYLATLEAFAGWYREQSKIIHVNTIVGTMKRLNQNLHGDEPSWHRLPEQRDLAAQYLLLYEMSLPYGLDLNDRINVDKSATRMIVTLKHTTTMEIREMDEKAREWLRANAPDMLTYGSGLSIIWAHISERNIKSMLGASFGALALISVILIFALRSFRLGLLSLVPNLAPAFTAFGLWGLLAGQVGLALSVVVAMTLGIVVDDTVHFMSKYLRARRERNLKPSDAVRFSFNNVGAAMWITTLALACGFMLLSLSGYKMNAEMGLMTALTITIALALDFLFLPPLLMKTEKKAGLQ
ncbi:MAG: MMPL family transporter [Gammaproteobacteria bacterium]|nr:MMPL family transporter [Gammaproteobacteria bacterium]